MKIHRRTRLHKKQKAALGTSSDRNPQMLVRRSRPSTEGERAAPLTPTPVETVVHEWPLVHIPFFIICEDGTVMRPPTVTAVIEKHTRMIVSWHMS